MPPLQIIVIRFVILPFARLEARVLLVAAPSRIDDSVLVAGPVVLISRFDPIVPELEERLEDRLALVRQIVRDAPVHALREYVVRRQSLHGHAKRDLRITSVYPLESQPRPSNRPALLAWDGSDRGRKNVHSVNCFPAARVYRLTPKSRPLNDSAAPVGSRMQR